MDSLQGPDIKALEQTRQRLFQLTNSLAALQQNIQVSPNLPAGPSLQQLSTIIAHNLNALTTHLSSSPTLFSTTVAYPLPAFPAVAEEQLLVQLLRKKLEVGVEDWVHEGRETGALARDQGQGKDRGAHAGQTDLTADQLEQLWAWAGPAANEEARARDWVEEEYTLEEREGGLDKVVTGLRGRMGKGESEDEDEDEDDSNTQQEAEKPPDVQNTRRSLSIEEVLRFMSTGTEAPR